MYLSLGFVAAVLLINSCVSLGPGEPRAYGFVWTVSQADMRAAIAASRSRSPSERITHLDVQGHDTIYVYIVGSMPPIPTYNEIRRISGKWRYVGGYMVVRE